MRQDEIGRIAEAVHDRLMNGPIKEMKRDIGEIKGIVSGTASKIGNLYDWMKLQDERITDLETASD